MSEKPRGLLSRCATLAAVVFVLGVGVAALVYLVKTRPRPKGVGRPDPGRLVRVFTVTKGPHQMVISAYGTAQAGEEWSPIAEVAGRALKVDQTFEPGEFSPKGTVLVQIDPADYKLAVDRFTAEVTDKSKRIEELAQKKKNLAALKALRERQVALARSEYDRRKGLLNKSVASQRELEQASNNYLAQLTALQELTNQLELLPTQKSSLEAGLALARTRLEEARRNLARTRIEMPFAGRCVARSIKPNQYARAGETLGKYISLDVTRVMAMLEARQLHFLFPRGIGLGRMDFSKGGGFRLIEKLQIRADVVWDLADQRFSWKGKVVRFQGVLDPATRTLGVTVEVPDPYKDLDPGKQPPLVPDMFCEVRLYGARFEDAIVVPRDALREKRIYLLRDGKLKIVPVKVLALQEHVAVIDTGLSEGDKVILSDLFPAIEGMPLRELEVPNPARQKRQAGK